MTVEELNAIRRRCECCEVQDYDDKQDLSRRIKDSIKRSVDGDWTYEEVTGEIRREVLIPGADTAE